jgi:hypothetical protein
MKVVAPVHLIETGQPDHPVSVEANMLDAMC